MENIPFLRRKPVDPNETPFKIRNFMKSTIKFDDDLVLPNPIQRSPKKDN